MKNVFAILSVIVFVMGCALPGANKAKVGREKIKKVIYNPSDEMRAYYTYTYCREGKAKKLLLDPSDSLTAYWD